MKYLSFIVFSLLFTGCTHSAEEWPQYLGPNRDGSVTAPGLFGGKITLERSWIQPLGKGFSGVVVGGGKIYTMYAHKSENPVVSNPLATNSLTRDEAPVLACFDAATGAKLWSYEYGNLLPESGPGEAGPLSTPVLDGNMVYGLGARGELFGVDANSGRKIWARNIIEELGAVPPPFGLASSPLVSGDLLILNVGGKDKGIAAFHKNTGSLEWHLGGEKIEYQSPSLVTLMGRRQVLSLSDSRMRGLEPATGRVLWEEDVKKGVQMIPIGDDMILSDQNPGFALYRLNRAANTEVGKFRAGKLWNNELLALDYDMPVHHKGYLYGFKGNIMTCLKLETGEKVWSSRDAGPSVGILADGHLALVGRDGRFRIVRASPKGYQERTSIKVFEKSDLTEPSYAGGVFYMRNPTHIAAVRVK
ncbi:MAG: PQQ-like beta-propeller repeat protein [Acidobacteriota bacterium]|nr:PQQ-like beta-propeller repeat protein [Acidobacteriota bacterium]